MTHWLSAAPVAAALMLALAATVVLWRELSRRVVAATGLFVAAGLTYEATLVVGVLAVLLGPRALRRRFAVLAGLGTALAAVGAWSLATTPKRGHVLVPAARVINGHIGSELVKVPGVAQVPVAVVLTALVFSAWQVARPSFRPRTGEGLVLVGCCVIVTGTLPFVLFGQEIDYLTQADRATAVSDLGVALVFVGIGRLVTGSRLGVALVASGCRPDLTPERRKLSPPRRWRASAPSPSAPGRIVTAERRPGVAQCGRNWPCGCGSGRKAKRCCGVRRGPSPAELAKAYLAEQRRRTVPRLVGMRRDDLRELFEEMVDLPVRDVSLQLRLPRVLSPELEMLRDAIDDDDEDEVDELLDVALAPLDDPGRRAELAREVLVMADAGRVDPKVAAVAMVDLTATPSTLMRASLLRALAVSVGAARTPAGLLVVSRC